MPSIEKTDFALVLNPSSEEPETVAENLTQATAQMLANAMKKEGLDVVIVEKVATFKKDS